MKIQLPLFSVFFFVFGWHGTNAQTPAEDSAFVADNFIKIERRIAMRDGMRLFTAIYVPKDAGPDRRYPILMERTPYSVEPYGADKMPKRLGPNPFLLRSKYIFVYQDVRGRYMSEGVFEEMTPHKSGLGTTSESSDTYDTVNWLLENVEGNNGRVGLWGISYPGFYATASLPDAHPAIKAVSPQAPVTDEFIGDDVHHNGAFFLMDNFFFTNYFDAKRDSITTDYEPLGKFKVKDAYAYFLKVGPIKNAGKRHYKHAKIWNEYLANDTYTRYWQERNIRPHLKDVKPATLVVGGWFDAEDLFGALNTYRAIEQQSPGSENFLVMGPWTHGAWASRDWSKYASYEFGENTARYFQEMVETPFFNHYLKDEGEVTWPEALLFETGSNTWKTYDQFPPKNATETALYLQSDNRLGFEKSKASGSFDSYVSDPAKPVPYIEGKHANRDNTYMAADQRFAAARPDVLTYESEVLTEDLTLTGPLTAELYVATSGTDADFVVKLIDVLPAGVPNTVEGFQRLVRAEVMRGKFRDSCETPSPFTTNYITKVAFQTPDVAHTFKKGHRLMVQVQSSWFPLVDRNPQVFMRIPEAEKGDFKKANIRLFHDMEHPSQVRVWVVGK
ncbi:MAG: CocE/NonD family hydrolase [Bacteroidetes bacterium]|nr:CocE/NonD family hydrolase [Bacteroidota bacterium]